MVDTLLAWLAVLGGWTGIGAAMVGVGRVVRRLITGEPPAWSLGDFWTGLAATLALLYAVHLVAPIHTWIWVVIGPVAVAGLLLVPRPTRPPRWSLPWVGFAGVGAVYLADRALQPTTHYDSGLYHIPTIEWVRTYAAVPGIANFHGRLGYNSGTLMYDALVSRTVSEPLTGHFANGLLALVLCFEVLVAAHSLTRGGGKAAEYAPSIMLLLATPALLLPLHRSIDISSPSLDLPALVVAVAAAFYVGRILAPGGGVHLVPTVSLLLLLPLLRVQLVVFTFVAGGLLLVGVAVRRITVQRPRRALSWLTVLAVLTWGAWAVHGVVLSGYPAYPASLLGMPVSWRVPHFIADDESRIITAWARQPGLSPKDAFGNTRWVRPWAQRTVDDPEVLGQILLLTSGLVALALAQVGRWAVRLPGNARRVVLAVAGVAGIGVLSAAVATVHKADAAPLAVLVTAGVVAVVAVLLMTVASLLRGGPDSATNAPVVIVGLAAAASAATWLALGPDTRLSSGTLWLLALVPAAGTLSWAWQHHRPAISWPMFFVVLVIAAAYPARGLQQSHILGPIGATGTGPLGFFEPPVVGLRQITRAGVTFNVPVPSDQCWAQSLPCTPYPDSAWTLRTPGHIKDGFTYERRSSPSAP